MHRAAGATLPREIPAPELTPEPDQEPAPEQAGPGDLTLDRTTWLRVPGSLAGRTVQFCTTVEPERDASGRVVPYCTDGCGKRATHQHEIRADTWVLVCHEHAEAGDSWIEQPSMAAAVEDLPVDGKGSLYDRLRAEFDAHLSGKHDQRKHGRGKGGGRAGMGDIGVSQQWAAEFKGGSAEAHLIQNPDGTYQFSPERQALHDEIINDALAGKTPSDNPTFNILGGGPASGKSSILRTEALAGLTDTNTVIANADEMKAKLPEYQGRIAAGDRSAAAFAHAESSYMTARLQAATFENRYNLTLDSTGDSAPSKLQGKIARARSAGYRVEGHYVTVDTELAIGRAQARGERTGRFIPESVIREVHSNVSKTAVESYTSFDAFDLYDTTAGSAGGDVNHVMSYRAGTTTINDQGAWDTFVAKGAGVEF